MTEPDAGTIVVFGHIPLTTIVNFHSSKESLDIDPERAQIRKYNAFE